MTSASQNDGQTTNATPKGQSARPQVPFVRVLDRDNLSECPADHNFLIQMPADLAYSRNFKGGSVIQCPIMLRTCPLCKKWYIDPQRLINLEKQGIKLQGFDIVGSATHPRPSAYELWHPEATAMPVIEVAPPSSSRKIADTRPRNKPVSVKATEKNLAFHCRYCDGGKSGRLLGFRGVCTQACYYQNVIEFKDEWCSDNDNQCQEQRLEQPDLETGYCYESRLLNDWACGTGFVKHGHSDPADRITGDRTGFFALATTVLPRESEANRRIFAVFQIGKHEDRNGQSVVTADPKLRLEFMADEPLYYWKFFQGKGSADDFSWDNDPYRNISQDIVIRVLYKATRIIKDPDRKAIAELLFTKASASVKPEHLKKLMAKP